MKESEFTGETASLSSRNQRFREVHFLPSILGRPGTLPLSLSQHRSAGSVVSFITHFYCIVVNVIILAIVVMVLEGLSAVEAKECRNLA